MEQHDVPIQPPRERELRRVAPPEIGERPAPAELPDAHACASAAALRYFARRLNEFA